MFCLLALAHFHIGAISIFGRLFYPIDSKAFPDNNLGLLVAAPAHDADHPLNADPQLFERTGTWWWSIPEYPLNNAPFGGLLLCS